MALERGNSCGSSNEGLVTNYSGNVQEAAHKPTRHLQEAHQKAVPRLPLPLSLRHCFLVLFLVLVLVAARDVEAMGNFENREIDGMGKHGEL